MNFRQLPQYKGILNTFLTQFDNDCHTISGATKIYKWCKKTQICCTITAPTEGQALVQEISAPSTNPLYMAGWVWFH